MSDVHVKVAQVPGKEVPLEVVAEAITEIAAATRKLLSSRLTKRAIIVLLKDRLNSVKITDIEAVIDAAAQLERDYCKPAVKP